MHAVDDDGIMVEGLGVERSWEHLQIRRAFTSDHTVMSGHTLHVSSGFVSETSIPSTEACKSKSKACC